jgi:hypothetical protein
MGMADTTLASNLTGDSIVASGLVPCGTSENTLVFERDTFRASSGLLLVPENGRVSCAGLDSQLAPATAGLDENGSYLHLFPEMQAEERVSIILGPMIQDISFQSFSTSSQSELSATPPSCLRSPPSQQSNAVSCFTSPATSSSSHSPVRCRNCSAPFFDISTRNRHEVEMHNPEFDWACSSCGMICANKRNCQRHIKNKHADSMDAYPVQAPR